MNELESKYVTNLRTELEKYSVLIKHISKMYDNVKKVSEREANIVEMHWRYLQKEQEIVQYKLEGATNVTKALRDLLELNEFEEQFGPQTPLDDEPPF